jgi:ABC-type multidrug transport system fused ATPase/permease subunit
MARVRRRLSSELFVGYLRQPYAFHVQHDAASLIKVVFDDVDAAIHYLITPLLMSSTRAVVVMALLTLVLLTEPAIAATMILVLGLAYFLIYRFVRRRQTRLGAEMSKAREARHRAAIEGLGGIKELLVLGREHEATRRFDDATSRVCRTQASNSITGLMPRYLLETVAFGGIVMATLTLVLREGSSSSAISTLALYALVGYRLLPAGQQIFSAAVELRFGGATLESLERNLGIVRSAPPLLSSAGTARTRASEHDVRFEHVHFTYPGSTRPAEREYRAGWTHRFREDDSCRFAAWLV